MKQTKTFLEFYQELLGFRVFKERFWNGRSYIKEVSKSELYWGGVTLKEIYSNPNYKIEKRKHDNDI
jgi:hypothetical protein